MGIARRALALVGGAARELSDTEHPAGALPAPIARTVTAASTGAALTIGHGELILADATNGAVALVLASGAIATVKRTDATPANLVTVAAPSGKTVGDQAATSVPLRLRDQAQTFVPNAADPTNFVILSGHNSLAELDARFGAILNTHLLAWAYALAFRVVSATRDANDAITTASVVWPDGSTGTFTTTTASAAFPGAVDAFTITYVPGLGPTKTVTQAAVTRNANGAVTAQPALAVT